MKKKILWIILIILILLLGIVSYVVINNNSDIDTNKDIIKDDINIQNMKLNIVKVREYNSDTEYLEYDTKGLEITINDKNMNICYSLDNTCEVVEYTVTGNEIIIDKGDIGKFSGNFSIIKNNNEYIFISYVDNLKIEYYFN